MKQPFERSVSLIRSCVERGLIPSAALAMGIGDEVMVKECWGVTSVTEDAQPVNSQTLYDMASVSKIYATTMITLRFIERGILDLADMLPRYFGDLVPEDETAHYDFPSSDAHQRVSGSHSPARGADRSGGDGSLSAENAAEASGGSGG